MPTTPPPTIEDVERIAALQDPVVRNLQITQCYHELSGVLAERSGPDANWCTFATWASKQAGQTIRNQDLARTLEAKLKYGPAADPLPPGAIADAMDPTAAALPVGDTLRELFDATTPFARASAAVARGNLKVFAEIGREFARFNDSCLDDPAYDSQTIDRFCASLRLGDPPDGQQYLRQAFQRYYQARFVTDEVERAQLLLLANIQIGYHEQTRLQPEILEALEAPVIDPREVRKRTFAALFPARSQPSRLRQFWDRVRGRPSQVDQIADHFLAVMRDETRFIVSDQLMAIALPQETRLRLGRDLRASYPPSLQKITEPELLALLERIDPTPDSTRASGAGDWGNLPDRLGFIVELFRCYQEWPPLFEAPFTPEQLTRLRAGQLPDGRL